MNYANPGPKSTAPAYNSATAGLAGGRARADERLSGQHSLELRDIILLVTLRTRYGGPEHG